MLIATGGDGNQDERERGGGENNWQKSSIIRGVCEFSKNCIVLYKVYIVVYCSAYSIQKERPGHVNPKLTAEREGNYE